MSSHSVTLCKTKELFSKAFPEIKLQALGSENTPYVYASKRHNIKLFIEHPSGNIVIAAHWAEGHEFLVRSDTPKGLLTSYIEALTYADHIAKSWNKAYTVLKTALGEYTGPIHITVTDGAPEDPSCIAEMETIYHEMEGRGTLGEVTKVSHTAGTDQGMPDYVYALEVLKDEE